MTDQKIEMLSSIVPSNQGLNYPLDFKVTSLEAAVYDFYSYKYATSTESHTNSVIRLECTHPQCPVPLYVNIFYGATYRDTDVVQIAVTEQKVELGEIYFPERTLVDGEEIATKIENAFRLFWMVDSDNEEPSILDNNPNAIPEKAEAIMQLDNIILSVQRRTSDVAGIKRDIYRELQKCEMFQVVVLNNNNLERLHQMLSKQEAEEMFLEEAKYWYQEDAVEAFKMQSAYADEVTMYEEYLVSELKSDEADYAHVFYEKMNFLLGDQK